MWRIDNRTEQRESCVRHVKFEGGREREREGRKVGEAGRCNNNNHVVSRGGEQLPQLQG